MKNLFLVALPITALLSGCAQQFQNAQAQDGTSSTTPRGSTPGAKIESREEVVDGVKDEKSGLTLPRGFKINVFADGLSVPRRLAIAPGGTPERYDVFVAESKSNRIRILRDTNGDGVADEKPIFTQQTAQPYGLAFHPDGWLYVGNTDSVVRFPYKNGETSTEAKPEFISKLTAGGYNQHWTRNLLFSPDSKKLYVTVGSSCNTCEEGEEIRAAILQMNPDGSERRVFASGLRNPVGLAWRPGSKELWTVVNERDNLGDDVPPDYLTKVTDGSFHGWPYAYTTIDRQIQPDPTFGETNPQKVKETVAASVPVQAHSAVLGVVFYPKKSSFPAEYSGDAFLAYHGSWNRSEKTGYKIVRVNFEKGQAVSVTDFVRGYLKDGRAWGRPVDVQIAPDGSLLFSDDGAGVIWRVSYDGE